MSMRTRLILVLAGAVLLVVLWFLFLFRPNQNRINELQAQQEQASQEITQLQAELARLEELRRQEPQLRAELARLQDALPTDPRLPDFILQVQEAATLAGIDFLSITPSLPAPFQEPGATTAPPPGGTPGQLQSIAVSLNTTGQFFEIEDFIIRMERLQRAVRMTSISLAPGATEAPGGSPTLTVTFQLQMFLVTQAPVQPGAPAPQPGVAPAPGATPAPAAPAPGAPTPAPAATPVPGG